MKDVKGFENFYAVSEDGIVFSKRYQKPLKPFKTKRGYLYVDLYDGEGNRKRKAVHQLVAETYLNKPSENYEVDHIDGNKCNNHVSNLEWVTRFENLKRSNRGKERKVARICIESGNTLAVYNSIGDAERDGFKKPEIIHCCKGRIKSHYGYRWEYVD